VVFAGSVTTASGLDLAEAIRTRSVSAVDVVEAHIAALEATSWTNALVAERFDAARREAAEADNRIESGDTDLPPFLGVPITVKELLAVEGMPHSGGFPHRKRLRETTDAPTVARLRAAGVVILGVGNTPGPFYWLETNNKIYGRTSNAYDASRTAGGSSGGDAVMVASGGAAFAIGSDMGGSIRVPAFVNGIFGHLPSPGLVPITGHFPMPAGEFRRTLFVGPLTRRAADLMPVLRTIAGPDGEDPNTEPMPLGDPASVSMDRFRVLISTQSSTLPVRPALRGALEQAASALDAAGADVQEVSLRRLRLGLAQFTAVALSELDLFASWSDIAAPTADGRRMPSTITTPARLLRFVELAPARMARTLGARRLADAARRASDHLAETIGDGVLLYPPFPRLAPKHRSTLAQPWLATNTAIFNLFGLPVTQVPLGLTDAGLPVGVQVVAAPGNDHVSIAAALELERACGGWVPPKEQRP
jgi:fatty acid amide hydrolase 2